MRETQQTLEHTHTLPDHTHWGILLFVLVLHNCQGCSGWREDALEKRVEHLEQRCAARADAGVAP